MGRASVFMPSEGIRRAHGTRSNDGVRLMGLVGRHFRIGDVLLEGIKEWTPGDHLQSLVGRPVLRLLVGRGRLRARICRRHDPRR